MFSLFICAVAMANEKDWFTASNASQALAALDRAEVSVDISAGLNLYFTLGDDALIY
jgi:hypothetical protein